MLGHGKKKNTWIIFGPWGGCQNGFSCEIAATMNVDGGITQLRVETGERGGVFLLFLQTINYLPTLLLAPFFDS